MKYLLLVITYFVVDLGCTHHERAKVDPKLLSNNTLTDSLLGKKMEREFTYYFHILDSATRNNKSDTIVCCHESTWFMEEQTKIESAGEKGYAGNISFTKGDLQKWHHWYDSAKATGFFDRPNSVH